jgi:hypothetical protein
LYLQAFKLEMAKISDEALLTDIKKEYRAQAQHVIPYNGLKLAAATTPTHIQYSAPSASAMGEDPTSNSGMNVGIIVAAACGGLALLAIAVVVVSRRGKSSTPLATQT